VTIKEGRWHESSARFHTPLGDLRRHGLTLPAGSRSGISIGETPVAAGLVHRIPEVIWITLFFIGILGTTVIGYRAGLSGTRGLPATLALILAFSAVMILIMDLDRPGQSLFQVLAVG
jgi:hypothetical protein